MKYRSWGSHGVCRARWGTDERVYRGAHEEDDPDNEARLAVMLSRCTYLRTHSGTVKGRNDDDKA